MRNRSSLALAVLITLIISLNLAAARRHINADAHDFGTVARFDFDPQRVAICLEGNDPSPGLICWSANACLLLRSPAIQETGRLSTNLIICMDADVFQHGLQATRTAHGALLSKTVAQVPDVPKLGFTVCADEQLIGVVLPTVLGQQVDDLCVGELFELLPRTA